VRLKKFTGREHQCCGALLHSVCGGVGQVGQIRSKKKRRARLIGSLDMGLRLLGQPKDVLDFRTFFFFFFLILTTTTTKKAPKEAGRHSSAKGERKKLI